jgi:phage baseplate assembly protein gpV
MSDREGSLQEVLVAAFQNQMSQHHTAIPCIVVAIRDSLNGAMVDIQPAVNQRFKDGTAKERPVILGVPVSFPVSTTAGFTFPIEVGSSGMAIFSMRNLDAWKNSSGRPTTPLNFAKFDKGDAMFIPGIQPPSVNVNNPSKRKWGHSTKDAVLVNNIGTAQECEVRLKPSGDMILNTDFNVEVNCKNATVTAQADITLDCINLDVTAAVATFAIGETTWVGDITHTGNLTQTGNYTLVGTATFNGIVWDTHKHIGVTPGVGTSGGPTS